MHSYNRCIDTQAITIILTDNSPHCKKTAHIHLLLESRKRSSYLESTDILSGWRRGSTMKRAGPHLLLKVVEMNRMMMADLRAAASQWRQVAPSANKWQRHVFAMGERDVAGILQQLNSQFRQTELSHDPQLYLVHHGTTVAAEQGECPLCQAAVDHLRLTHLHRLNHFSVWH